MKNEGSKDGLNQHLGLTRRDALKAVAMLAATPLVATGEPLSAQAGSNPTYQSARTGAIAAGERDQPFDDGWKFLRGEAHGAEMPEFEDASWRVLDLPHDFSVEELSPRPADGNGEDEIWGTTVLPTRIGPFDTELSAGGRDTGWMVGGIANVSLRRHYRRTIG